MKACTYFFNTTLAGAYNKKLLGLLILCFVAYSFCITRTVVAVNDRKDLRADIRDTQTRVAELEINYFALAGTIDMTKAYETGFVESTGSAFVYTNPPQEAVAVR
jgi:hypothetical protein